MAPSRLPDQPTPVDPDACPDETKEERVQRQQQQMRDQMCAFAGDPEESELVLHSLNSFMRMRAHEMAEAFGLGHTSGGDGKNRHIKLSKEVGETFELDPNWQPCESISKEQRKEQELQQMIDGICAFAEDPEESVKALPPLNSFLRLKAHEQAEALGLGHDSVGDGRTRHIVLTKSSGEMTEKPPSMPPPPPRPAIKIILKKDQPAAQPVPEERRALSDALSALDEDGDRGQWLDAWHERLECWWAGLPMPTQSQLGACMGALGLHIGSKLDASMRALGWQSPQPAGAAAESNCDWLQEDASVLELPTFPAFDEGFKFQVPPIPRLLPSWEHLQAFALEEQLLSRRGVTEPQQAPAQEVLFNVEVAAAGFALAAAASLGVWVGVRRYRQQHVTRAEIRSEAAPPFLTRTVTKWSA